MKGSHSKSPLQQRPRGGIVDPQYSGSSVHSGLNSTRSEANISPLNLHYSNLKDFHQIGKEITKKAIEESAHPLTDRIKILAEEKLNSNNSNSSLIYEEIKQAKKCCSTCLKRDVFMLQGAAATNYKIPSQDKSHRFMMQDPDKNNSNGGNKVRVLMKKKRQLGFVKLEYYCYEPPIHSIQDLELGKLRDDNTKLLQKVEDYEASRLDLTQRVLDPTKRLVTELITFLNRNGAALVDTAISNQKIQQILLPNNNNNRQPNVDPQQLLKQLEDSSKELFQLNIRNDDLKQKLCNLQDTMAEKSMVLMRSPVDQASDNIIESQKHKIQSQNKNINRLGTMLLNITTSDKEAPQSDSSNNTNNTQGKIKILTEKAIEWSAEVEKAQTQAYEAKKKYEEASLSAYTYMVKHKKIQSSQEMNSRIKAKEDKIEKIFNIVKKYPLVFPSFVDQRVTYLDHLNFENDVSTANNLLSKESLQYEHIIQLLKEENQQKSNEITQLVGQIQSFEDALRERDTRIAETQQEMEKLQENLNQEQMNSPIFAQHMPEQMLTKQTSQKDRLNELVEQLTNIILSQNYNIQDESNRETLRQIFGQRYFDNFCLFEKQKAELKEEIRQLREKLNSEKEDKKNILEKIKWYAKLLINVYNNGLNETNLDCLESDMTTIQLDANSEIDQDVMLLGRSSFMGRNSEFSQMYLPPLRESRQFSYQQQEKTSVLIQQNKDLETRIKNIEDENNKLTCEISQLNLEKMELTNKYKNASSTKEIVELKKEIESLKRQGNENVSFRSESRQMTPPRRNDYNHNHNRSYSPINGSASNLKVVQEASHNRIGSSSLSDILLPQQVSKERVEYLDKIEQDTEEYHQES